jgi:hypothetical protein
MTPSSSSSSSSTTRLAFSALRRRLLVAVAVSLLFLSSQVAVVAQAPAPTTFTFTDDTAGAPVSVGNAAGSCSGYSTCLNNCRSTFYKVTGASAAVTASTCGTTDFPQRSYVWLGSGGVCSTFTCTSTYRGVGVRMRACLFNSCPLFGSAH